MKFDNALLIGGKLTGLSLSRGTLIATPKPGQLSISEQLGLQIFDGSAWQQIASTIDMLYEFNSFTFSALAYGSTGVLLSSYKANASYKTQPWINNTNWFDVVGGIQNWQVPVSGIYEVVAVSPGNSRVGGATVSADIALSKGDTLKILCGQRGDQSGQRYLFAGTGGTFVASQLLGPLVIAGGPGGSYSASGSRSLPSIDLSNPGDGSGGATSTYSTSNTSATGGGGAGYSGDAHDSRPARSFLNGGAGGQAFSVSTYYPTGGFGGGGSGISDLAYGGGGGYTGGNGGKRTADSSTSAANGGTSFVAGLAQVTNKGASLSSAAIAFGTVTITLKQLTV